MDGAPRVLMPFPEELSRKTTEALERASHGKSLARANHTVDNIETLFRIAKANNIPVFISPHYYYAWGHKWESGGPLEVLMHQIGMFDRRGPLTVEGFQNSGADWMPLYKPYINDGITVIASPHKVYGPETNDLVL